MATVIRTVRQTAFDGHLSELFRILPRRLFEEFRSAAEKYGNVEELRCRKDKRAFITAGGENIMLDTVTDGEDMGRMFNAVCQGSVYAHKDTLLEGYVTVGNGIRVGICGRAVTDGGRMIGVYDISGLNLRLPSQRGIDGEPVCRLLREGAGVLIYSPPGVGKTTLLRGVIKKMASGDRAVRVCVIDTRGELSSEKMGENISVDVLTGYPRGKGIEIATRSMNAQLIVCDEIGDLSEADSIIAAQNCGVPIVATAHSDSIFALMRRTGIRRLHDAAVFDYYVGISRKKGVFDLEYSICKREDADDPF